jgi:hypothetical protein
MKKNLPCLTTMFKRKEMDLKWLRVAYHARGRILKV